MSTIIIILAIILILFLLFSYKLKKQTINFYSGGLGSGKTLTMTKEAIKDRRKSVIAHYLFSWNIGKFPKFKDKFKIRTIYSNYPILLKGNYNKVKKTNNKIGELKKELAKDINNNEIKEKIKDLQEYAKKHFKFSKPLKKGHLIGEIRLEEKCIINADEVQILFPNQNKRSDPLIIWNLTFDRHFIDPTFNMASQSIGNVDISIRRVINVVYNFSSFRKLIPLIGIYKIDVNKINYMEDVVTNTNDINQDKTMRIYNLFGKKRYNSRYMRKFYQPKIEDPVEKEECLLSRLIDKVIDKFKKKDNNENDIVINDDDNIIEIINNSFVTSNFEFIDFDIDPLDDYISFKEYKDSFYGNIKTLK